MNQKFWSSFTTASLLITSLGASLGFTATPSSGDEPSQSASPEAIAIANPETAVPATESVSHPAAQLGSSSVNPVTELSAATSTIEAVSPAAPTPVLIFPGGPTPNAPEAIAASPSATPSNGTPAGDVIKVGEFQSASEATDATIATIHEHQMGDRSAATLYIRDIPVLTFLGNSGEPAHSSESVANASADAAPASLVPEAAGAPAAQVKVASVQTPPDSANPVAESDHPAWRATAIAAQINQWHQDNTDASTITAAWDEAEEQYVIKIADRELVAVNQVTILPDTTQNPAEDVLQAANRMRRLLGDAPPLTQVTGAPIPTEISLGPIRVNLGELASGLASWYGPGFHGNYSASGEVFNQNALTAAHPSLPFGTQVRVTNLDTGLAVVVRINDRGPFTGGRVIDLSAGAAQVIGLISAGVAPVSLEVVDSLSANSQSR